MKYDPTGRVPRGMDCSARLSAGDGIKAVEMPDFASPVPLFGRLPCNCIFPLIPREFLKADRGADDVHGMPMRVPGRIFSKCLVA